MKTKLEASEDNLIKLKKAEQSERILLQSFFDFALPLLGRLDILKSMHEELLTVAANHCTRGDGLGFSSVAFLERYKIACQPIGRPFDFDLFLKSESGAASMFTTQFKTTLELMSSLGINSISNETVEDLCQTLGMQKQSDDQLTHNQRKNAIQNKQLMNRVQTLNTISG